MSKANLSGHGFQGPAGSVGGFRLLRQAIERGHAQGYLKSTERDMLADSLEGRHE